MSMTEYDEEACIRAWRRDGIAEGMELGAQQKAIEDAKNALSLNLSVEQVSKITNLPLERIIELQVQTGFHHL